MGNCFKSNNSDDISLLRDGPDPRVSGPRSNNARTTRRSSLQPTEPPPPYEVAAAPNAAYLIFHPSPSISRPLNQLTEDEQVRIAQRMGLINHLPLNKFDGTLKKAKECIICMIEFSIGDMIRILPCMHIYHKDCIDDWLMRSFTCPSCIEPVDAALLCMYEQA